MINQEVIMSSATGNLYGMSIGNGYGMNLGQGSETNIKTNTETGSETNDKNGGIGWMKAMQAFDKEAGEFFMDEIDGCDNKLTMKELIKGLSKLQQIDKDGGFDTALKDGKINKDELEDIFKAYEDKEGNGGGGMFPKSAKSAKSAKSGKEDKECKDYTYGLPKADKEEGGQGGQGGQGGLSGGVADMIYNIVFGDQYNISGTTGDSSNDNSDDGGGGSGGTESDTTGVGGTGTGFGNPAMLNNVFKNVNQVS
jgi:hypothetical protein